MSTVRTMSKKFDNHKNGSAPTPPKLREERGKFPVRGPVIKTTEGGVKPWSLRKSKEFSLKTAGYSTSVQPLVETASKKLTELHRGFEESMEPIKEEFEAEMGRILSEIPPELYAEILPRILFDSWENYDSHMEKTKHTPALRLLLKQALELSKINPDYSNKPIFGHNILEMAGGTGTIIKLLCDQTNSERVGKLQFTLNDISERMKQVAEEKLKDLPCGVRYTGQDIRKMRIRPRSKDTAIMSQVLHLITNPKALEEERQPGSLASDYNLHTVTKIDVIRRAFGTLRQNGYFMLIDEWPAVLSLTPENSYERKIYYLFKSIFRPIGDPMALRNRIMKNVTHAKFVAELKIPIDRDHSMYLHLYRKEYSNQGQTNVPDGEIDGAQEKLVKAFTAIDKQFLERYRLNSLSNDNGPLVEFLPVGDEEVFDSRNNGKKAPNKADKKRYNGAIVADKLYTDLQVMPDEKRIAMMQSVIDAVNTGGWMMVMGEWSETGMTKQYFRDTLMRNYNVIFEAALRARIQYGSRRSIYGYLYRKRG